jgi:predicted nucleic acid-binding protein
MKCVDTTFCVDFLRGLPAAVDLVRKLEESGEHLVVPGPVVVEFMAGPFSRGGRALTKSLEFLARLEVKEASVEIAIDAARLGGDCLRAGHPQGAIDLLVASTAKSLGCSVITRDTDFNDMPGVTITAY